ncbi:hypothetical protein HMPREF1250_0581 [Megasphaera vaginalis (ex Srinivasan et al. 2021)]|uniref:Uncharacterized protein n=1 Tax=Megasphaera vaginalis (ex Srinivasan et al. 2021) TaxID=1111454 RepID=U7US64_9FIRM|nr:hypothetical protein HMPREF1250_0581 [Megasphaera vaginalis (ex Srinivasan et al. 2021)]
MIVKISGFGRFFAALSCRSEGEDRRDKTRENQPIVTVVTQKEDNSLSITENRDFPYMDFAKSLTRGSSL